MDNPEQTADVKPQTAYSVQVLARLQEAFHNDYTIDQAARYAGISRQTYYNWIKDIPGFEDKMEDAQNKLLEKAGEVITKAIADGDSNTAKWYKDRRDPRYKSKVEAVINADEQALEDIIRETTNDPNNLPDDSPKAQAGDGSQSPPVD